MLRMYQMTQNREYLERGLATVDGFLETQTPSEFRIARMEGPTLLQNGRKWYAEHGKPSNNPNYVSTGDLVTLLVYDITRNNKYLESARRAVDASAAVFPNFDKKTSTTRALQFSKFLCPPALLYGYTGVEEYRVLFRKVLAELRAHQHETGAIPEWGNYGKDNFGEEGPVIINDGEPISDQLYSTNFALMNLREACFLLGDKEDCESFLRLGDYLVRIQTRSTDARLDGTWTRAFDFKQWESFGSNSDPYYGPYSIESGWTHTIIAITLIDYLQRQSAFQAPHK